MSKTCMCEIRGKLVEGLRVVKENQKTVIVEYKGKHIKRHKEKHYVTIEEDCV